MGIPDPRSPHQTIAHRYAVVGDAPGDAVFPEPDDNLLARHGTVMRDATTGALRCNKPPEAPPGRGVVRRQLGSPFAAELRPDLDVGRRGDGVAKLVDEGLDQRGARPLDRAARHLDGLSVSIKAADALATLDGDVRPDIQSDHGSGFIARDFVETLSASGVTHTKIRPHTPTDNAEIERYHRTIGEQIEEHELQDFAQARAVIAGIIEAYNTIRLHSALSFLRPADYYRGDPETLLAERRRRLQAARELRKQENIKLRQRLIPWRDDKTTPYPKRQIVSL